MSKDDEIQIIEEDPGEFDLSFKLIVIGDSFVGKSCLSLKASKGVFNENYTPTIGFEFLTFFVKIGESIIKLQIWDTCGQEVYRSLISSFYHNSSLAILVYSIDNINSYNNIESWLNEIKSQANPEIKIFLIGNKTDLENERQISKEEAQRFSSDHIFNYFIETSAKTGFNAQSVFIRAAKELYITHLDYKDRASRVGSITPATDSFQQDINMNNNFMLDDEEEKPRKKKGCC